MSESRETELLERIDALEKENKLLRRKLDALARRLADR